MSKIIELYIQEAKLKWTEVKTETANRGSLNLLVEILGDVPMNTVKRSDMLEFFDIIQNLPPNKNKLKKYRDKSILEILKMDVEKTLGVKTVNDHMRRVAQMFTYACRNEYYTGYNPAEGISLKDDRSASERRAPFTPKELNRLFRSGEYLNDTFKHPYQFWIPIIALFHGMRQNEIAQLHLSGIYESPDGVWVFDLNTNAPDKKLKNKASRRIIPIHPFLIEELNLIGYCDKLKIDGEERLFPELTGGRDGYGRYFSRWFNAEYKIACNIADVDGRKKDFHSFRANFTTDLFYKQLRKDLRLRIAGHSTGNDEQSTTYDEDFPPKQFFDEITTKVDFHKQLDLSHL